jgi:hypothetical protein
LTELQKGLGKLGVTVSKPVLAILAILFGIQVILMPDLLEWTRAHFHEPFPSQSDIEKRRT